MYALTSFTWYVSAASGLWPQRVHVGLWQVSHFHLLLSLFFRVWMEKKDAMGETGGTARDAGGH